MKIGFVSLGCPKNLVDSEVMMGLSQEGGHTLTPNPAEADVLVVNTCAFIDSAKEESSTRSSSSRSSRKRKLQAAGGDRLSWRTLSRRAEGQIPEIDAVLGTGDVPEIVGAIEGREAKPDDSVHARSARIPNP